MNDHIKTEIPMYLSGELTESRNRQIEAHAAACEKCRGALSKARSKQARHKREALKKAAPDRLPNLFLTRQGKDATTTSVPSGFPKFLVVLALFGGASYWGYQKWSKTSPVTEPISVTDSAPDSASVPTPTPSPAPTKLGAPVAAKPITPPVPPTAPGTPITVVATKSEPPKAPLVLPVLQSIKGSDCAIQESRVVVVRREEAFDKLWEEMQAKDPRPTIDFSGSIILGVFAGTSPTGTTIEIGKIEEMEDAMYAPYRVLSSGTPAPASTATTAAPVMMSHPYLMAVVPRTDRKIKLTRRE